MFWNFLEQSNRRAGTRGPGERLLGEFQRDAQEPFEGQVRCRALMWEVLGDRGATQVTTKAEEKAGQISVTVL